MRGTWDPNVERPSEATRQFWERAEKRKNGKLNGKFLRGPIPLPWLVRASDLSKSALKMALLIWHLRGLNRSELQIHRRYLVEFQISRTAAWRGLRELEKAGLIEVDHQQGKAPRVTILE